MNDTIRQKRERLNEPVVCAGCQRRIPVEERVYRTRGLMRHNGKWVGECCTE